MHDDSPFACVAHGNTQTHRALDYEEARRALALFADPALGAGLHLHARAAPPSKHWKVRIVPGADLDAALAAVRAMDEGNSAYFGLNPVPAGMDLAGKDVNSSHITYRRWLALDIDRPKGDADLKLSATNAEKQLTHEVAVEIIAALVADGWPEPVITDSGNGCCLCYRIDLPNDRLSQVLLRNVLAALADRFDRDGVTVDKSMHDARRVIKLPGSWACKGPDTPDRPHRRAGLLGEPEKIEVVSVELLKAAAGVAKAATTGEVACPKCGLKQAAKVFGLAVLRCTACSTSLEASPPLEAPPFAARVPADRRVEAYIRAAFDGEVRAMASTPPGELNTKLNQHAFVLGTLIPHGLPEAEVLAALAAAAKAAGADSPAKDESTLLRAVAAGKRAPRVLPVELQPPASAADRVTAGETITYRASSVTPRKVEWLWPGRVPLGKLTTFAGVKGMGKTFVLCDMAARVTRGGEWPGAGGECAEPGQVLFISGEDDPEDTLVPRLMEMGADLHRIVFLKTEVKDAFTIGDLKTLDRALNEVGGARFIAIDPPTAFLGKVDDHKNSELRGVLAPLASWSARWHCATAFVTHVSKPGGMKVEAMMRVMGSVAWVNAVRAAHMFARDPEDADRRLFLPLACNLGPEPKALAYKIARTDELARIEWLGEVETTADEALNTPRGGARKMLARDWLVGLFRQKLEWPSDEFWASANLHGIKRDAVFEARVELELPKPRKVTTQTGDTSWVWWVPPEWKHLSKKTAPEKSSDS